MPVDKKFIVNFRGKDFVMVAGVLDLAHQQGLISIDTEILAELCQPEEKRWIVRAVGRFRSAEGEDALWSAHGDADPSNTQMKGAELRHAETRAIARMLRFATNVAMTAYEELGPDSEPTNGHQSAPQSAQRAKHDPQDEAERQPAQSASVSLCEVCGVQVPAPVATAARKQWNTVLCLAHGRERRVTDKEAPAQMQGA